MVTLTVERILSGARPGAAKNFDRLLEAREALLEWFGEQVEVIGMVTHPHPEPDPPARQVIDHRDVFGQMHRIVQRGLQYHRAKIDPPGTCCQRRHYDQRRRK